MRRLASRSRPLGLSLLSAVLLFLSVPTFGLWPLMWVALVPQIVVALDAPTHKRAFLYGWLTGTVANAVAFSWMDGLLERFGHMPPVEALPIMGLLVGYQGLAVRALLLGGPALPAPGARSSVGERSPHTREVAGSNPAAPIGAVSSAADAPCS